MALTTPQLQTLNAAILATPEWSAFPLSADGDYDLARVLNGVASPNFWVWSSNVDVGVIRAAIVWANLTPTDTPDGTQQWANRSLQCQGKQFNLQMIIPFSGTLARLAKYGEKILADTTIGNGSTRTLSATMVFKGNITPEDVRLARLQ